VFVAKLVASTEQVDEVEVTEVVDSHGHLKIVLGFLPLETNQSCVVDEHIDALAGFLHRLSEFLNGFFISQIQSEKLH
jgi:hypothetical protein